MNDRIQEIRTECDRLELVVGDNPEKNILAAHVWRNYSYLLSEVERLTRYLERISVTFGEFECQRLAKEALSHLKG